MEILPEDVWHQILKTGTETDRLDHQDLCSLSMTCHGFDKLAQDSALWATLLARDLYPSDETPSKALYREQFESRKRTNISFSRLLEEMEVIMADWGSTPQEPHQFYVHPFIPEPLDLFSGWEFLDDDDRHSYFTLTYPEEEIGQSSTTLSRRVPNVKEKFPKRHNKGPRPKVYPSSKSYIPMHKPPRRAMARKI